MLDLVLGNCVEVLPELGEQSVDAVVCDPPYGIGFMGRQWDASRGFQAWCESWGAECLRVLKPGGHLVAFGGTRTYHRLAAGLEDAGFEIRDQLAWLFGSGFPKSRNLDGDWKGWGTALKPAFEPIILARKPLDGTVFASVTEHGVGALNIDGCRIEVVDREAYEANHSGDRGHDGTRPIAERGATDLRPGGGSAAGARWPANVLLDEEAAAMLDEQTGVLTSGANPTRRGGDKFRGVYGDFAGEAECEPARGADAGGASRFFYCAKVSRHERSAGLEPSLFNEGGFEPRPLHWSSGDQSPGTFQGDGTDRTARNNHPTVKPIALMRWLCRLVAPPVACSSTRSSGPARRVSRRRSKGSGSSASSGRRTTCASLRHGSATGRAARSPRLDTRPRHCRVRRP